MLIALAVNTERFNKYDPCRWNWVQDRPNYLGMGLKDDIHNWMLEQKINYSVDRELNYATRDALFSIRFVKKSDAVLFKLTWG
jgi:hypothetical protein